ncbi:MAG TPA: right-handed parallel beta-helix repeat-containing protein [Longimicrobium sp.]|nr:right-handed parallel beta-helix repeat-containing protein [Longimicrobium sp.]
MAAALAAGACERGAPLHPADGRALPPGRPSALLNPLCGGSGGTTHAGGSITTAVTWAASGNPHRVTATVILGSGGQLTLQPGVIVCFSSLALLQSNGGRLVAQGLPASRIVLTATDPALGWKGVSLSWEPSAASVLKHVTIEYTERGSPGVSSFMHPVAIDSTVIRQSGRGVDLWGRGASFSRSRVDTTTNRDANIAAVTLHDSTRFEQSVILHAASNGLRIEGAGVQILGGRIEGSGGIGIVAEQFSGIPWATPLRVVGGGSYPISASVQMLRALYTHSFYQDSLLGNARDTVLMRGGTLRTTLLVRSGLPWHVTGSIDVLVTGALRGEAGSRLVMDPGTGIQADSGGRVLMRGSPTNPVVLTAEDPSLGWAGITVDGTPNESISYITNTRVEHVAYGDTALVALGSHSIIVDSAVFRRNGRAISIFSAGSRLSRTRVDTTLSSAGPAVELGANTILESTLIRGSSKHGLLLRSSAVQVLSCEVRGSVNHGIYADGSPPVHNCNLVGNGGVGLNNPDPGVTVNATGNWWGDAGGPTAPAGDGVGGPVTYSPWLTAPVVLPYVP